MSIIVPHSLSRQTHCAGNASFIAIWGRVASLATVQCKQRVCAFACKAAGIEQDLAMSPTLA